jgi:glycosyltransferase involved in cell wall biosynthesis
MIRLTIAISTFNRCNYLEECLNSILPQVTKDVNIVVSDNDSTDETPQIMQKYCVYPFVRYYRKETNTGMDGNFLNCLNISDGEYIHLMSDDDIMLSGTVNAIIECITNDKPDLIHLNSCGFNGIFNGIESCSNARFVMKNNFVTKDKNVYLSKVGIYLTYLSSLVLKNELVKQIVNPEQFLGTFFLQSHVALLTSKGDKTLAILKHNSIAARSNNTGGYNLFKIWIEEYKKLLFDTSLKSGYAKKSIEDLYVNSVKSELKGLILRSRIQKTELGLENRSIIFRNTYMFASAWIYLYPVTYFPVSILKLILKIRKCTYLTFLKSWVVGSEK